MVEHVRFAPRRGGVRASWWGKVWHGAVEEASYSLTDLKQGQKAARAGAVGRIQVGLTESGDGYWVAGVEAGDEVLAVSGAVTALDPESRRGLVEVVAAGAGRIGSLLAGELPRDLVADAEEVGVELLPWSGDLKFSCSCEPWADPCPHAVAVATQIGWLMDADPFVLLTLRGCPREWLLGALDDRLTGSAPVDPDVDDEDYDDLTVAEEAALRMERVLRDC